VRPSISEGGDPAVPSGSRNALIVIRDRARLHDRRAAERVLAGLNDRYLEIAWPSCILAWFGQFRRLSIWDERRADVDRAFPALASA
jgi:hypothetical protein